jgi:NADPH-dependent 2,4-dienoyl-CoA reductase/sulfur reductase-like enzyme
MKAYDVIIIGGGPSGLITGVTAQKQNPQASFLMIKEEENGLVPCGIPYVFHDLDSVSQNKMGPAPFVKAGGEVLVDRVTEIDLKNTTITTKSGIELSYRKLVLATGSTPTVPTFIKGHDLENVETIPKSFNYITGLKERVASAKSIVVIGGGFIGAEVAEQIAKHSDKNVTIVEMMDHCLGQAFSPDFAILADENLRKMGINVLTGNTVEELIGKDGKVHSVKLKTGETIEADMVISAIGYKPNTDLAKRAGLQITSRGTIRVDRFMRTDFEDVFAVGDCSETFGFITGRTDNIMLASTATAEARILGYNLCKIGILRTFAGTLSVFSTELNGYALASAGAIEQSAEASRVDYVTGSFSDMDRHPGTLPGAKEIRIRIIVSPRNGEIIGGEIYGGKSIGEMINIIALAIQKYITVYELVSFQVGTHPLLTTAPTKYSLIKACEDAISKINCNHG